MSNFVVCIFATRDTAYTSIAETTIIPSLKEFNISYSYSVVPNLGSWNKNTSYKATFALEMLNKYPTSNIVLLDVDCKIASYPHLFDAIPDNFNVAAHVLDWATWYQNGTTTKEFLTGTLFLRNSERTRLLVQQWIDDCAKDINSWEQKVLANVLVRNQEKILVLPLEYCYINSLPDGRQPNIIVEKPVIFHYQASRELKRTLK